MNSNKMQSLCDLLIKKSLYFYESGNSEKSIHYAKVSTRLLYAFNWRFTDESIENLFKKISDRLIKQEYIQSPNRVVFYDAISIDNRGLTQQYVRAILQMGYELLYMTTRNEADDRNTGIISELRKYNNCRIVFVPAYSSYIKKSQFIYDNIMEHSTSRLFMHLRPDSVSEIIAFYGLSKNIIKYQINLTNHAYWVGSGCVDYSFEFNNFGMQISQLKRNISKSKLLYLPFYPISTDTSNYKEIKEINNENVILMSGGVVYKITDKNDTFLNLIKEVLTKNPSSFFLWAGGGDLSYIEHFVKSHNLEDRFLTIGNRTDINQVFEKVDIFVNTYPIGGGLMCQLAAYHKKPILSYAYEVDTCKPENTICQLKEISISSFTIDDFLSEAEKLISNENYRRMKGDKIAECIITEDYFQNLLQKLLNSHKNEILPKDKYSDYSFTPTIMSSFEVVKILIKELKTDLFCYIGYIYRDLLMFPFYIFSSSKR